jgi:pimeloyl-ACP methyl ester carboxylesterase
MWRWTSRLLIALCGLIVLAAIAGTTYQWLATRKDLAATPPPGHLVDIGGYRLHLSCTGDGAPAVILDTGLGGSGAGWGFVQPDVARFTRVCSYDRAGMGYSDPGPSPRTARRIASELAELLARSGITGPVVLVGASIAGFNVRVFASDHPDRAAGLVLVDASHEDDAHQCHRWRDLYPCCRRSASSDCSACGRSASGKNPWLQQCGSSRRRHVSAQPDTRRRLTRSFTFVKARRRSGARAARSPSLFSSSPVHEEPTRIGGACNEIKPRSQRADV